jgi:hypothetical protein
MSAFRWDSNITGHFDHASTLRQTVVFRNAGFFSLRRKSHLALFMTCSSSALIHLQVLKGIREFPFVVSPNFTKTSGIAATPGPAKPAAD